MAGPLAAAPAAGSGCCTTVLNTSHWPALLPCYPACAAAALAAGVDYYRAQLLIPEVAYELNFVFSNGEGLFDNNFEQVRQAGAGCIVLRAGGRGGLAGG